jgi:prophage tail gpP-like protein
MTFVCYLVKCANIWNIYINKQGIIFQLQMQDLLQPFKVKITTQCFKDTSADIQNKNNLFIEPHFSHSTLIFKNYHFQLGVS